MINYYAFMIVCRCYAASLNSLSRRRLIVCLCSIEQKQLIFSAAMDMRTISKEPLKEVEGRAELDDEIDVSLSSHNQNI